MMLEDLVNRGLVPRLALEPAPDAGPGRNGRAD